MNPGRLIAAIVVAGALIVLAGSRAPVAAQTPTVSDLKTEIERLRTEMEGIRSELRLIREILTQRAAAPSQPPAAPTPTRAIVSIAGAPTLGKPDAPLTMVEFSDYQCPFCRRHVETTLPAIKKEYVETGKVRYVFRDFPIDQLHPMARRAAEVARCAGDQGKFWPMHDLLFQGQQGLGAESFKSLGDRLALDATAFGACLDGGRHRTAVQKDYDDGVAAGVRGTPAFFLGRTGAGDTVDGLLISGARPLNDFRHEIERLLAEKDGPTTNR